MQVRLYHESDFEAIRKMHDAMHVGYKFPTLGPLFAIKRVATDDDGNAVGAAALKLTSEAFLWLNTDESTLKKTEAVAALNLECAKAARSMGLDETSCWVPSHIEEHFAPMLLKMNWRKSPWNSYTFTL